MGEAKARGNFEQRREDALYRDSDVVIWLQDKDGALHFGAMPQRDLPEDNMALVFASFLNANLDELMKMARQAYQRSRTALPVVPAPKKDEPPKIVTEVTPRIIGPDGPATGEVRLLGADGIPVQ